MEVQAKLCLCSLNQEISQGLNFNCFRHMLVSVQYYLLLQSSSSSSSSWPTWSGKLIRKWPPLSREENGKEKLTPYFLKLVFRKWRWLEWDGSVEEEEDTLCKCSESSTHTHGQTDGQTLRHVSVAVRAASELTLISDLTRKQLRSWSSQ